MWDGFLRLGHKNRNKEQGAGNKEYRISKVLSGNWLGHYSKTNGQVEVSRFGKAVGFAPANL